MRNIVIVLVLFFGLFFSSCTKDLKVGPGINKTVETTVDCLQNVPSTAPRWGCDGRKLDGQKITGWTTESTETTKMVPCNFSHEELTGMGYVYTGTTTRAPRPERIEEEGFAPTPISNSGTKKSNTGWSIPWEWLFFIAAGLAILLFLLWLLRELMDFRFIPRNPQGGTGIHVVNPPVTTPPVAPTCQVNNCNCNQQGLNILQSMVDRNYSFTPQGKVSISEKGTYLGIRNEKEVLMAEIIPQNQTSMTSNWSDEDSSGGNTEETEPKINTQT